MNNRPRIDGKGQIEVTFNWVYILIAGAAILLFFAGIVIKQKNISEQNLASDVVRIMESIFTGGQASEKTKSSIPLGGLSEKAFYFSCEEGVSEYGVSGLPARIQNNIDPVFSANNLQGSRLILWSLPYLLPIKITDFLMVTSDYNYYYLLDSSQKLSTDFLEGATDSNEELSIPAQKIDSLSEINYPVSVPGEKVRVRIIDAQGETIKAGRPVPEQLRALSDQQVTALSLTINQEIDFFGKEGTAWKKLNLQPVPIVSLGGSRDAAWYGAIFTEDPETYLCNMQKAYQRIRLIAEVYENKVNEMEQYYLSSDDSSNCRGFVSGFTAAEGNVKEILLLYKTRARACSLLADSSCVEIIRFADQLRSLNELLAEECSLTLY